MRPDAELNDPEAGKSQVSGQGRRYFGANLVSLHGQPCGMSGVSILVVASEAHVNLA
jgi:hypothetical protein